MRALAEYVMLGRRQAIMIALLCSLVPFLGWMGTAIMALVTLRKGMTEGALVLLWIALPAAVFAAFQMYQPLVFDVLYGDVLVWLMAALLRQTLSWGLVLEFAALIGAIGVIIVHIVHPDISNFWVKKISEEVIELQKQGLSINLGPEEIKKIIRMFAKIGTGLQALLIISSGIFNLFFARWWQALVYNPGGLHQELYEIRLSFISAIVVLVAILGAVGGVKITWDILPVLLMPFFWTGLSLAHGFAMSQRTRWLWLFLLYGILVMLFPQFCVLLITLAWLDTWLDFRKRLRRVK